MSADTVSSLFPDRPIRPLPRRRLRERLSPDVADSIQYPPAPPSATPLFYYSYSPRDDESETSSYDRRESRPGLQGPSGTNGLEADRGHDAARLGRIASLATSMSGCMGRPTRSAGKQEQARHAGSQPPQSAASSADGYYDPFEITNNKKKRKIPSAGDSVLNGNHGGHDGLHGPDSPGTPVQSVEGHGELPEPASSSYQGHGGFAAATHNVSGPGRGRYGRVRNGRSPLRSLSDASGNWAGRNEKLRSSQWVSPSTENTGIISTAIANAEKLPLYSGQENLSLLQQQQQQQSTKAEPATTQFTFTCESQVPGSVAWPGTDRRHTVSGPHVSITTRDNGGRLSAPAAYPPTALPVRQMGSDQTTIAPGAPTDAAQATPAPPVPPRKTRRRLNDELRDAARLRRQEARLANRRHPPSSDNFWICEFCEYEDIFREPPKYIVRKFEMKDRKLRMEAAERKRLLEKAKSKGRKGRKNAKAPAAKSNGAPSGSQARTTPQGDAGAPPLAPPAHDPGPEDGEEYYEEEEDFDDGERKHEVDSTKQSKGKDAGDGGGGDGTQGHGPLRPPAGAQPHLGNHASTADV